MSRHRRSGDFNRSARSEATLDLPLGQGVACKDHDGVRGLVRGSGFLRRPKRASDRFQSTDGLTSRAGL